MMDVIDILELNITVGHPNGTTVEIRKVGNLKLTNNIVLFDVLVIPEYCVSLLSVNKLVKDSKLHVGFDEYNYIIQDLKKENILGTGSEAGGLYVFNIECEEDFSEGNNFENFKVPNLLFNTKESNTLRRPSRQSKLPPKLNDYVLDSKASPHMHAPLQSYMDLGLRVLRYLKGTLGSGINFEKFEHMSLKKSKKQATLFKFSAEVKYRSMATPTYELMWIVNILKDLKVTNLLPAELFCDNSASIEIAANHIACLVITYAKMQAASPWGNFRP
uniref:Ribonuclease H-like domain-containing protein n=1 Tax=Tanacetum cinerariifolium TaxID=118510 RepID=A0A699IHN7_TANCI|nr:ribonuclease H-like domain-containing protein [Tanacetum cinerariifolium]